jgi:hypothetical protein
MAKKGRAIYLVYTDLVDDRHDEEFNTWYNTRHLPQLRAIPGILDAARYIAVKGGPKYLAIYELESAEVIRSDAFVDRPRTAWDQRMSPQVIGKNFTRILGEQIFPDGLENADRGMAAVLQVGRMSVPEAVDAAWNDWYNGEYIPGYRTCQASSTRGGIACWKARSVTRPSTSSRAKLFPRVRPGTTSASTPRQGPAQCATP